MFFNIDSDTGEAISGWVAPDNPSAVPKLALLIPGRPEAVIEADIERADIRDLGLHASGRVGFNITDAVAPGLAHLEDIEILDAETRTPLYRRFRADRHFERKLFLFDSAAMPQRSMIQSLTSRFALNYTNVERYSLETMIVLLNNHFSKSLFFCGRASFNRYASFLENGGYLRAALLREPVQELAERLLFLSLMAKSDAAHLIPTYATGLTPLVDFAKTLKFDDHKNVLTAFRQIDEAQRQALVSPMTRMLGCTLDEPPTHHHVSLALDHLSSLDVVGTRARFPAFKAMLEQFLGGDVFDAEPPAAFPTVEKLTESLSNIGIVHDLLEHDMALYFYVEQSLAAGLKGGRDELPERAVHTI
ncbi:MAG: hypothetical protein KGM42_12375 [Hyphomicrobiales bacterium]|nr:hypothetical protein [Hyphomicrobiales bacterium]